MGQVQSFSVALARDTDANWLSANPIIGAGIIVIVQSTTTGVSDQIKIGDGVSTYSVLPTLNASGSGAFLGIATTATNPGTLSANSYYLATAAGTYTNFPTGSGPVVLATGTYLAILSYNSGTGHWTATVAINSTTIPAATLDAVLAAGYTTANRIMQFTNGGATTMKVGSAAGSTGDVYVSITNGVVTMLFDIAGLAYTAGPTVMLALYPGDGNTVQPRLVMEDPTTGYGNTITMIPGTGMNVTNTMPTQPGELAVNNGNVASITISAATSFTVNHGLGFTPRRIMITPEGTPVFAAAWCTGGYITNITGTQFTVNFPSAQTGVMKFWWQAF